MHESERRPADRAREERLLVERAAAILRHDAVQDHHAGFRDLDSALYRASSLDAAAVHLQELPEPLRRATLAEAQHLIRRRDGDGHRPVDPLSAGDGH